MLIRSSTYHNYFVKIIPLLKNSIILKSELMFFNINCLIVHVSGSKTLQILHAVYYLVKLKKLKDRIIDSTIPQEVALCGKRTSSAH